MRASPPLIRPTPSSSGEEVSPFPCRTRQFTDHAASQYSCPNLLFRVFVRRRSSLRRGRCPYFSPPSLLLDAAAGPIATGAGPSSPPSSIPKWDQQALPCYHQRFPDPPLFQSSNRSFFPLLDPCVSPTRIGEHFWTATKLVASQSSLHMRLF